MNWQNTRLGLITKSRIRGTGYCISVVEGKEVFDESKNAPLPREIEHIYPDYELYPEYGFATGFLTRGCPRGCGFGVVGKKEGRCSQQVAELSEFWRDQREIKLWYNILRKCLCGGMAMNTELLTVSQAATFLKLSERTVRRHIEGGSLRASKIGNRWRIRECDIDTFLKQTSNIEETSDLQITLTENAPVDEPLFDPPRNDAPRLISLFSGCGGLDLGFKRAGFRSVYANDFDADAQAVYSLNFGKIDGRDILTVPEDEIPDGDILIAGFPCQPFSNAGNRKGVHDSRGMLYKECLRIIKEKMPKVVVFENVKGLLSSKYLDGRNLADVIHEDLTSIGEIGYEVKYDLVNAADYGVPQNRQRVLFVGVRKDLGLKFRFPKVQSRENLCLKNVLDIPANVPDNVDWEH